MFAISMVLKKIIITNKTDYTHLSASSLSGPSEGPSTVKSLMDGQRG